MATDKYKIKEITIEEKNRLYKKSVYNVENDPSKRGLSPIAVKEMLAGIVIDNKDSILSLIEKIILRQNIINARVDLRISEIDGSGGGLGESLADWVLKPQLDASDLPNIPLSKMGGVTNLVDEVQQDINNVVITINLHANKIASIEEKLNSIEIGEFGERLGIVEGEIPQIYEAIENIEIGGEGVIKLETLEEANASPKAKKAGSIAFIKI